MPRTVATSASCLTEMGTEVDQPRTTFDRDLSAQRDRAGALGGFFTALCEGVSAICKRKGYLGKTIGLKLRYDNFKTVTATRPWSARPTMRAVIRHAAGECLKRVRSIDGSGCWASAGAALSGGCARSCDPEERTEPSLFDEG